MVYEERYYRETMKPEGLIGFEVIEEETDLFICADKDLSIESHQSIMKHRGILQKYILEHKMFEETFSPYAVSIFSSSLIKDMAWAAKIANVGPMAAVAGAISEKVGKDLLKYSKEIIVENGGDIFLKINKPRKIGIYAGNSKFSEKIAIEIDPKDTPCGICTSSGTVGHSFSYGKADAVTVIAKSTALADAAATAIGNVVQDAATIEKGIEVAKNIKGILGALIIKGDRLGVWGDVKIVGI